MYINYYKGGSIINKVAGKDTTMVYNKFLNLLELLKFIIWKKPIVWFLNKYILKIKN